MLVPAITIDEVSDATITHLAAYALTGDVLVVPSPSAIPELKSVLATTSAWVQFPERASVDTIVSTLDAGAVKAALVYSSSQQPTDPSSAFQQLPADRLALILPAIPTAETASLITQYKAYVSAFIVPPRALLNSDKLPQLAEAAKGVHLLVQVDTLPSLQLVTELDKLSINIVIPTHFLSFGPAENKLNIGEAFASTLKTDRPDGLFPTIVVDEQQVALGLCYSSAESISEAVRTKTGVYQSRERGLWYKGATSGATQRLLKITPDCDKDTLRFVVSQSGPGFCHLNTRTCFGADSGITALAATLESRKASAPAGSYTQRLFSDPNLLRSKIMEEAEELCEATEKDEIAWECADLIYFALTKCVAEGVTLADVEKHLDRRSRKVTRRAGNAKPKWEGVAMGGKVNGTTEAVEVVKNVAEAAAPPATVTAPAMVEVEEKKEIKMKVYNYADTTPSERTALLQRPIIKTDEILARVKPIMEEVRRNGDKGVIDLTEKFDRVKLQHTVLKAPFDPSTYAIDPTVKKAIDQAYDNLYAFHSAQLDSKPLVVETMPGVTCTRFHRPIERVGLYVPGGTAILPSTALHLGIPAQVAGCKEIVFASPPRKDGTAVPEVMYVAHKLGVGCVVLAGGAQAVAAMAYGTETVPKVDKICGPGNQYVTAAKMVAQADSSAMISIDMPAGPSELLVIADEHSNPAYVASDLLSQAEHGVDSQVVLLASNISDAHLAKIEEQVRLQGEALPRADIVRESIGKSFVLRVQGREEAMRFSNLYAPEHLILHVEDAEDLLPLVDNAGSVFVGHWSPESCGDYASGTNHTLPTYGYARMYSGVNTLTFVKHITSQMLTREGLDRLGDTVTRLAEVEGLEAHRNAVAVRLRDIRAGRE
ncbi:trifunctional histidinol dehydrogenase [Rhizophlyctis rosea]|uniref:Histidine biosynthesis trifunctional protein n=1 Tax=Rhizophlyctis rosea TaxID=64517 RepID=A0AAD5SDG0_9FUNG|nr:trifunctional histidinol dehydrogenase [Rhizophlyctis rosea]